MPPGQPARCRRYEQPALSRPTEIQPDALARGAVANPWAAREPDPAWRQEGNPEWHGRPAREMSGRADMGKMPMPRTRRQTRPRGRSLRDYKDAEPGAPADREVERR